MSACPIEYQQQVFVRTESLFAGESRQSQFKDLNIHRGHEYPAGMTPLRLDKARDIHPLIALLDHRRDLAAFLGPHPSQDWFETDVMLIAPPQFSLRLGIAQTQLFSLLRQFFFRQGKSSVGLNVVD